MCQKHENIKIEMDIIEDNTFDSILTSENNGTIKEEFCDLYNENKLHLKRNELSTCKRDQFSYLETSNNSIEKKMCQKHENVKVEMDIIEDNTFESILTSENNGTIKEEFCDVYNETMIHLEKNESSTRRRDEFSCLETSINYIEKKMCQRPENIKVEMDIIEDNTFESILTSENNGTIKEEFCDVYNETMFHLEKNELITRRRDEFSCLDDLKAKKYRSHENTYNIKDIINKNRFESIKRENNDALNTAPEFKITDPIKNHKHKSHTCKESPITNMNLKYNENKINKCDNLEKSFVQNNDLALCLKTSNKKKHTTCDVCKKSFAQNTNLKQHMRVHTREKPYECAVCKKSFNQNGNLKQHMKSHTGEKPYECTVCKKPFSVSSNLKRHMRAHTREKL